MDFKRPLLLAAACCMSAAVNASTIFAPTDGDVNFLNSTIDFSSGTTQVAMFNVGDLGGLDKAVVLEDGLLSSLADFTAAGGGNTSVDVKDSGSSVDGMTLLGSDNFILGLTNDAGSSWFADTGYTDLNNGFYNVHFADGSILQVDVQVVPIPAAVWLFASGLMGLVAVARRKAS